MPTALNPVEFTEHIVRDFLRYQATAFRFADARLREQLDQLLSLDQARSTPLLKGPYVSLSKSFRVGAEVDALVAGGALHAAMAQVAGYPSLYRHQEQALRSIQAQRPTLVSTGTGSGKTECFLYPVIDRMLRLRDAAEPAGVRAIFIYPMNALAEDQLLRLRGMLCGTGVTFGMYVGKTPRRIGDAVGQRLGPSASRADYERALERARTERRDAPVLPPEERASREEMRMPGKQPRILLTNVKQLELLLTRGSDVELFDGAELEYLVFDEAHTFSGAGGAETAALVRRLVELIGSRERKVTFVGTSATLTDPEGGDAPARRFASRLFGADEGAVEVITEAYEKETWSERRAWPARPQGVPAECLAAILAALGRGEEEASGAAVAAAWKQFQPEESPLPEEGWSEALYGRLSSNALCFELSKYLEGPRRLDELSTELEREQQRPFTEEELLSWLALGAAAQRDGRPLLRPKVHLFLRGLDGGVIDFPFEDEAPAPRLWLSAADQLDYEGEDGPYRLPITVCTTCGQHYFPHWVSDLELSSRGPGGGEAVGQGTVWEPLAEENGGSRVVLFDRLAGQEDDEEEADDPRKCHRMFLCRGCGTLHSLGGEVCGKCGRQGRLIAVWAVEHEAGEEGADGPEGHLTSCRSCSARGRSRGRRYQEPARSVRATPVADVHVLAQSMLQRSTRKRLLVFTDNRQEAAFQAGWMRDHARHFRMRALMAEAITAGAREVGDLVVKLEERFDGDDDLSRALLPEVWEIARRTSAGREHVKLRKEFLRLAVLLEITQAKKQTRGLEPWGRLKIDYLGLDADQPVVRAWAAKLGVDPERMREGFAGFVDLYRRDRIVLDRETHAFSRAWYDGDTWIQNGFLPSLQGVPKGLKLRRESDDREGWVSQLLSVRGLTRMRDAAQRLGVDPAEAEDFVRDWWTLVTEHVPLFVPVTLKGSKGRTLPGTSGVFQLDADRITLAKHEGRWRCQVCRKTQVRPSPNDQCLQYRCKGRLVWEEEDPRDYDLSLLDQEFLLIRPREHSAQVPGPERERIETQFKGDSEALNTLVCTPTLEMGVDIGGLDTVLLRNVPPLPANYWQRVGRAGRRHRLAVAVTYARPSSHDRAYFADPPRMLGGRVEPPRFNLANAEMIAKHVRATVITGLRQLGRAPGLPETDRERVALVLDECFPDHVAAFFFDSDKRVRDVPRDTSDLGHLIREHRAHLHDLVCRTFRDTWPEEDRELVTADRLGAVLDGLQQELRKILNRIHSRLRWHLEQVRRINSDSEQYGTPTPEEEAHRNRCQRFIKRLKGDHQRGRSEAEGHDDTYTWSVLAAEGFLPGYGLESGSVRATAEIRMASGRDGELVLGRAPAIALREYVPGNMIYANGQRYVARRFQLPPSDPLEFLVDTEAEAVREAHGNSEDGLSTMASSTLPGVPVSDCELAYASRISDEEEYRFQLPVAVYGMERDRHGAGQAYTWGSQDVAHRKAVHLRLVNVASARQVESGRGELGYPICRADGDSRSPLASRRELESFREFKEKRGLQIDRVAFYADVIVDALSLPDLPDKTTAWSLLEALRMAMSDTLDMEREDLQPLVLGEPGSDTKTALLYDPMPGGSGLLDQATESWPAIVERALQIVSDCPACCDASCIDCLQNFRNSFQHKHLDRHRAAEVLDQLGQELAEGHAILERRPTTPDGSAGQETNHPERRLRDMLERAHLTGAKSQVQITLGPPVGSTTPDFLFESEEPLEPGVAIYLDGLSRGIHGNPAVAAKDQEIRAEMRRRGYTVVEIAVTQLDSREDMARHFYQIAKELTDKARARELYKDSSWFAGDAPAG